MSKKLKSYLAGVATVYVLVAAAMGVTVSRSMPALNWIGATYMAVTWPGAMFCTATNIGCSVLPPQEVANHFFTFSEPSP